MQKDVDSIQKNNIWSYVQCPSDKNIITAKWIYKIKKDSEGRLVKLKAQVVARGFQLLEGADYFDTFAPVVRWTTIRVIIALATQ